MGETGQSDDGGKTVPANLSEYSRFAFPRGADSNCNDHAGAERAEAYDATLSVNDVIKTTPDAKGVNRPSSLSKIRWLAAFGEASV